MGYPVHRLWLSETECDGVVASLWVSAVRWCSVWCTDVARGRFWAIPLWPPNSRMAVRDAWHLVYVAVGIVAVTDAVVSR